MWLPHPCYDKEAHFKIGRIHLPVAPLCNIRCGYCIRAITKDLDLPGMTREVIKPDEAIRRIKKVVTLDPRIQIAAVAGHGDPLANAATIETFALVKKHFPGMKKCLSTNGLALPDRLPALKEVGLNYLTVTLNTVDPKIGKDIYVRVSWKGRIYHGIEAAQILLDHQLEGIYQTSRAGIFVKINTVFIPGVNSDHVVEVARAAEDAGACLMNIMPLIPAGIFSDTPAPTPEELKAVRAKCSPIIRQWYLCKQCRADAVGIPGEEMGKPVQEEACPYTYSHYADSRAVCSH